MSAGRLIERWGKAWRGLAVTLLGCAGLAACATPLPTHMSPTASSGSGARPYSGPPLPGSTASLRGTEKPYQIKGIWYYPKNDPGYDETGIGSWYGAQFHNRRTSNGEIFDMDMPSAAHKTLPLPSIVEVTNLDNGRKMQVRVNDRGPFVDGRIIDLSKAAAEQLGYGRAGVAHVRVRYIGPAGKTPFDQRRTVASAPPRDLPPPAPAMPPPRFGPPPREYAPSQYAKVETPPQPARDPTPADDTPSPASSASASASASAFRVQAGSYANRDNAERVAAQLSGAGEASVEPIKRSQGVLYRVVVKAGPDEAEAFGVRDRVASMGFSDATVLRP